MRFAALALPVLVVLGCGSGDDSGGSAPNGAATARQICGKLAAAGCAIGSEEQCESSIATTEKLAGAAACTNEFNALVRCRNGATVVCDAQGNLQSPRCDAENLALNTCVQG